MEIIQTFFNDLWQFAREGFHTANVVLGLLIGVVAAFMLSQYRLKTIIATTLGATIFFALAKVLVPVIDHNASLRLPDIMVADFWREMGALAIGLFIVITVIYFIRKTILPSGGHGGH